MGNKQEPTQPEGVAPEQTSPPAWEVKDGRIFIDGDDVTEIVNPAYQDEPDEGTKPPQADNAAVEGEGQEPEEPEEKAEPEPEKVEPEKPTEEPPEEPEAPGEPDKWEFKLKFRGKEEEVALTREEAQHRLAKLRAFEENEKEFWEKRREVEPYWNIVKSEWFKERLKEGYESGELKEPPRPPEPPPTVQYEILRRQADPDHDTVLSALQSYALSLPPEAMRLIDSDPTVFLSEYDRIAQQVRGRQSEPSVPKEDKKPPPKDVKKELEKKESLKSRASVTKPGTAPPPPPSPMKAWESEKRRLERAMRDPNNANRNLELTAQLLEHLDKRPT